MTFFFSCCDMSCCAGLPSSGAASSQAMAASRETQRTKTAAPVRTGSAPAPARVARRRGSACAAAVTDGWRPGIWLGGWLGGWVAGGWLAGWVAGWLAGWLGGWLAGWVAGWVAGWLQQGAQPCSQQAGSRQQAAMVRGFHTCPLHAWRMGRFQHGFFPKCILYENYVPNRPRSN